MSIDFVVLVTLVVSSTKSLAGNTCVFLNRN